MKLPTSAAITASFDPPVAIALIISGQYLSNRQIAVNSSGPILQPCQENSVQSIRHHKPNRNSPAEINDSRSPSGLSPSYTKLEVPRRLAYKQSTFKMLYLGITLAFLVGLGGGVLVGRLNNRFALRDPLTRLPNKPAFNKVLEALLAETSQAKDSLAILFLDIDHFKQINDCHGHLAGDEVLRQLGALLSCVCQPGNVFRWGGDEFTILTGGTKKSVQQYAGDIQQAIAELTTTYQQQPILITVSIGVAQQTTTEAGSELLRRADQALYQAKSDGRNQICWSDSTS